MNTQTKNATNVATTDKAKKAKKQVKQGSTESSYKVRVLDTNKALKVERLKLGYCIDDLLKVASLDSKFKQVLSKAKKDSATYKGIEANVKRTKNGFNAFYLLQYLHKTCK